MAQDGVSWSYKYTMVYSVLHTEFSMILNTHPYGASTSEQGVAQASEWDMNTHSAFCTDTPWLSDHRHGRDVNSWMQTGALRSRPTLSIIVSRQCLRTKQGVRQHPLATCYNARKTWQNSVA